MHWACDNFDGESSPSGEAVFSVAKTTGSYECAALLVFKPEMTLSRNDLNNIPFIFVY